MNQLTNYLYRQREFSFKNFGQPHEENPTAGVQDHLAKELKEVAENPLDVSEWIDIVILAFDGAIRAGFEPEQIVQALLDKQAKNERRRWPDWRTATPGKAIEHIRGDEQPLDPGEGTGDAQ